MPKTPSHPHRHPHHPRPLPLLALLLLAGCVDADKLWHDWDAGQPGDSKVSFGDTIPGLLSMSISPQDPVLVQGLNETKQVKFKITGKFASGNEDITAKAKLFLKHPDLGTWNQNILTSAKNLGGKTTLEVYVGSIKATTSLTVQVKVLTLGKGVPTKAGSLFGDSCSGGGPVKVVYPVTNTMLPPNLIDMAVMWTDSTSDLWEVSLQSAQLDIKLYTKDKNTSISGDTWLTMANTNRLGSVSLRVRGIKQASPTQCGASQTLKLNIGPEAVKGGIYYWSANPDGSIMRYDFGKATETKEHEDYYTQKQAGDCVGCHTVSPDGSRLAFTYTGGDGQTGILDIKKKTVLSKNIYKSNFQVFTSGNKYIISSYSGTISMRDGLTGKLVSKLDTGGKATHPELSPDGKTLVFVRPKVYKVDWDFELGSIVSAPLNGTKLGPSKVLVAAKKPVSNYYPAFSPDGKWIIFNRSQSDSYGDDEAQLWVVRASGGTPVELKTVNQGVNLRNSWARWSPFVHDYKTGKLFWFSFSSTRDYGTKLVNKIRSLPSRMPQIWMAAFDTTLAENGKDPTFPAFWLPFQRTDHNNHIAQWTKNVLQVK